MVGGNGSESVFGSPNPGKDVTKTLTIEDTMTVMSGEVEVGRSTTTVKYRVDND